MSLFAATLPVSCHACAGPLTALTPSTCVARSETSTVLACFACGAQFQLLVRLLPVCPDPAARERKRQSAARVAARTSVGAKA